MIGTYTFATLVTRVVEALCNGPTTVPRVMLTTIMVRHINFMNCNEKEKHIVNGHQHCKQYLKHEHRNLHKIDINIL